jgi:hypothetical protein
LTQAAKIPLLAGFFKAEALPHAPGKKMRQ